MSLSLMRWNGRMLALLLLWLVFAFALKVSAADLDIEVTAVTTGPGNLHIDLHRADGGEPVRTFYIEPGIGGGRLTLVDIPPGAYELRAWYELKAMGRVAAALIENVTAPGHYDNQGMLPVDAVPSGAPLTLTEGRQHIAIRTGARTAVMAELGQAAGQR